MATIDVIPGIHESTWQALCDKVALAAPHATWVHFDIVDGTMVPGETVTDFSRLSELKKEFPHLSFEAHLMVSNPEKYLKPLVDGGCTRLIVHVESNDPRRFFELAKYEDVEVGVAIDGPTEVEEIEPFLEEADMAVVMTAEAGSVGAPFLPEAVEKVKTIHQNFADLPIEVVGGITDETAKLTKETGATRLVSTHYLFQDANGIAERIEALKENI
jgi:ribulose-phosphate 3-epimerase